MGLILLEALGALMLLIGIVWWTMFSGRKGGELDHNATPAARPHDSAVSATSVAHSDTPPADRHTPQPSKTSG